MAGIKKDDIVFVQFPMYTSNSYIKYFIDYLQHQIGAKCVGIVHDVRAWQNKNSIEGVKNLLRSHESNEFAECKFLSQMDGLIVHNRQMAKRLKLILNLQVLNAMILFHISMFLVTRQSGIC